MVTFTFYNDSRILNPVFKVTAFFEVEYLQNCAS